MELKSSGMVRDTKRRQLQEIARKIKNSLKVFNNNDNYNMVSVYYE